MIDDEPYRLIGAKEVTDEITDHNGVQTTLRYFSKGVFHVYQLGGPTNKTKLTEERSARIRYRLSRSLQAKGKTLAEAGAAISFACGEDDQVTSGLLENGKTEDEVYEDIKVEAYKSAGI